MNETSKTNEVTAQIPGHWNFYFFGAMLIGEDLCPFVVHVSQNTESREDIDPSALTINDNLPANDMSSLIQQSTSPTVTLNKMAHELGIPLSLAQDILQDRLNQLYLEVIEGLYQIKDHEGKSKMVLLFMGASNEGALVELSDEAIDRHFWSLKEYPFVYQNGATEYKTIQEFENGDLKWTKEVLRKGELELASQKSTVVDKEGTESFATVIGSDVVSGAVNGLNEDNKQESEAQIEVVEKSEQRLEESVEIQQKSPDTSRISVKTETQIESAEVIKREKDMSEKKPNTKEARWEN